MKKPTTLRLFAFMIVCSILMLYAGCSETQNPHENIKETKNTKEIIEELLDKENDAYSFLALQVFCALPKEYPLELSSYCYDDLPEDFDNLIRVGIKGIPVIINAMEANMNASKDMPNIVCGEYSPPVKFYYMGLSILTRTPLMNEYSESYRGYLRNDIARIQAEILKIENSDSLSSEKILKLREFGLFAVPVVLEQIEKGNTEYEKFFTSAGFHLSEKKYASLLLSRKNMGNIGIMETSEFWIGSKNFDYKVWLSENEEDLNNLFRFLDAYCAEYEAEQDSK